MSLGKKDIAKNISSKAQISSSLSNKFLESFIKIISVESNSYPVKISNFGTFYYHKTPKRIGRNPKTKEEFPIGKRLKLSLRVSGNIRNLFN